MAAVLSMTVLGGAVLAAAPAYASGSTVTTTVVTGNHTSVVSGQPVTFGAVVSPAKVGSTKITGTVTWTVTDVHGTVIPCTTAKPLNAGGKSKCQIGKGILLAANAPFTAAAAYSGDANFAASNASTSVNVTPGKTHVVMTLSAIPTGGAATTVTVQVIDGPATALIQGNVVFTISSQLHAGGAPARCTGPLLPAPLNNVQPLVAGVATCNLPAGWMVIPKTTNSDPHPSDGWSVSAVYNGNGSFMTSYKLKSGTAKF